MTAYDHFLTELNQALRTLFGGRFHADRSGIHGSTRSLISFFTYGTEQEWIHLYESPGIWEDNLHFVLPAQAGEAIFYCVTTLMGREQAMTEERSVRSAGALTLWKLTNTFEHAKLKAALLAIGKGDLAPEPREPVACLKAALAVTFPHFLVRPLAGHDGFTVIQEERGELSNEYLSVCTVTVVNDRLQFVDYLSLDAAKVYEVESAIQTAYAQQVGLVHQDAVARVLVRAAKEMDGLCVRPKGGGIYWLGAAHLPAWVQLADAVTASAHNGTSTVYLVRHEMDSDSLKLVLDRLEEEVLGEVQAMTNQVIHEELGVRALSARVDRAMELHQKVERFEQVLQIKAPHLKEAALKAKDTAAMASLMAAGTATAQQGVDAHLQPA